MLTFAQAPQPVLFVHQYCQSLAHLETGECGPRTVRVSTKRYDHKSAVRHCSARITHLSKSSLPLSKSTSAVTTTRGGKTRYWRRIRKGQQNVLSLNQITAEQPAKTPPARAPGAADVPSTCYRRGNGCSRIPPLRPAWENCDLQ